MKEYRKNSPLDSLDFKQGLLKKEIRDIYTAYVVELTLLFPNGTDLSRGPLPFITTIYSIGIDSRAYSYRVIPNSSTGGYTVLFYFVVCSNQLNKLQSLLGYPGKLTGTLDQFPGLSALYSLYSTPSSVGVSVVIEEALIFKTKGNPSFSLREEIILRITGAGFTVSTTSILQNNFIVTAIPRDIRADNDAKLLLGAVLPILGTKCFAEKDLCKESTLSKCSNRSGSFFSH